MSINKSDKESCLPRLLIQNQYFPNRISLAEYIESGDFLPGRYFVNCNFEKFGLIGTIFGFCKFQNCTFNQILARKAIFSGCFFFKLQVINLDITTAYFYDTDFKNCEFLGVDLAASDFNKCKLESTRFFKSYLDFLCIKDVKVWKSKEKKWVEIKDFFNFEKHLEVIRPDFATAKRADLNFLVDGQKLFTYVNIKIPLNSELLKKTDQTVTIKKMAYDLGQKCFKEKRTFVGLENGPLNPKNVGHVVDLSYIPYNEKVIIRENVLKGARNLGSDNGIQFLNDIIKNNDN